MPELPYAKPYALPPAAAISIRSASRNGLSLCCPLGLAICSSNLLIILHICNGSHVGDLLGREIVLDAPDADPLDFSFPFRLAARGLLLPASCSALATCSKSLAIN